MKYYIRTTGERNLDAYKFLEDYEIMIDKEHKPIDSFIKQLIYMSNEDAIMLEDDIIFSKDFNDEVDKAIKKFPNKVINFFYMYLQFMPTQSVEGKNFLNNQCVYYPKGVAKEIALKMKRIIDNGCKEKQYDKIQAQAMNNLGIDFISYRPMIVQHIGGCNSMMGNVWINDGKSIFFKDDLPCDYDNFKGILDYAHKKYDELGIDYPKIKIIRKGLK